jgi:Fic/DOC family protein
MPAAMSEVHGLRLAPSASLKEKRLQALLQGRDPSEPALREAIEDAQILGSLELAGVAATWEEVQADRRAPIPGPVSALRRARSVTPPQAALDRRALGAWHAALFPEGAGWRQGVRRRDGTEPAPPETIPGRIAILEEWMGSEGAQGLKPVQQAALVLARVVEILPFEDGNGRVARLGASHLMVRGGLRPPILVGGDARRLVACLQAAFRFDTEPLCALLTEASERCLDVMIQTLERAG